MVSVNVCVSELDDKFACVGIGDMCDHMREERIGSDVEWDSEAEVGRSLKEEAREPWFLIWFLREVDIKLAHHMTRW